MEALVSTEWLADALGARDLRVFDATLLAADTGRHARAEFDAAHIPGAGFLNLAELRDTADPLPNMLPPPEKVASRLRALGVGDGDRIVLYDDSPWRTAARAWFVLRSAGLTNVALLDGGLAKWRAEGRPLTDTATPVRPRHLTTAPDPSAVRTLDQVAVALRDDLAQVVDARSAARFTGEEADPNAGTAAGHMPGARNLPYPQLFAEDGTWLRGAALEAAFRDAGVDPARPVIATCGSGVTAAVLLFGLHLLGHEGALYDGSWSEWGARADTDKTTGAA